MIKKTKLHSVKLVNCEDLPKRTRKKFNLPDKGFVEIYIEEEKKE